MKITITQGSPYELENQGTTYTGFVYNGFCKRTEAFPKGIVRFSTPNEHRVHEDVLGFDESKSEDVELKAKIFGDKVTYQEKI